MRSLLKAPRLLFGALVLLLFLGVGFGPTSVESVDSEYVEDKKPVLKPRFPSDGTRYQTYLCIDGGGLRGIIPSMILKEFKQILKNIIIGNLSALTTNSDAYVSEIRTVKDFHVDLADFFDGFAGISAGSWIATYLASKGGNGASKDVFSLAHIVNKYGSIRPGSVDGLEVFFMEYGRDIYPPPGGPISFSVHYRWYGLPKVALRGFAAPIYPVNGLQWVLKRFLGDTKLTEVSTGLLVCAFDLYQRTTIQFVSEGSKDGKPANVTTNIFVTDSKPPDVEGEEKNKTQASIEVNKGWDYYIRDITRASSAFPMINEAKTLKPLREIHSEFELIDGAMVGNNPTVQTLVWASNRGEKITLFENMAVISLGTGFVTGSEVSHGEGGALQWFFPMVELILGATPEHWQAITDYMFYGESLPRKPDPVQLLRIQPIREEGTEEGDALAGLGSPETLAILKSIGEKTSYKFANYLRAFAVKFIYGTIPESTTPPGESG